VLSRLAAFVSQEDALRAVGQSHLVNTHAVKRLRTAGNKVRAGVRMMKAMENLDSRQANESQEMLASAEGGEAIGGAWAEVVVSSGPAVARTWQAWNGCLIP